jgi:hypothetical protein
LFSLAEVLNALRLHARSEKGFARKSGAGRFDDRGQALEPLGQVAPAFADGCFSSAFEETTACLARVADKTSVTKIMGIAWMTVGKIVERIVGERLDSSRLDGLSLNWIDEFSYRKPHRYITVIVDHVTGRVVWAAKGRSSEALAAFFRESRSRAGCKDRGRHAGHG